MFGIDYNKGGQERQIANMTTRNTVNGLTNIKQDGTAVCVPINQENDGTSRTIKAQYSKNSGANFIRSDALGATGAMLKIKEATSKGYAEAQEGDSKNLSVPESKTRRGRVGKGVANTLDTSCEQGVPVIWYDKYNCYIAIRKLTPRECWRLQSFTDEEFDKAQFVNSDSQLYKQAGNSVTVNVVYEIGKALK